MKNNLYRSNLSKAKNLGAAGSGVHHWWHQRFTAVILLLITAWVYCFAWDLGNAETSGIIDVFQKPYHVIMLSLFVIFGLYHAALGMQVVIEDYVHCRFMRLALLLTTQVFSIITAFAFIIAILYVMTL